MLKTRRAGENWYSEASTVTGSAFDQSAARASGASAKSSAMPISARTIRPPAPPIRRFLYPLPGRKKANSEAAARRRPLAEGSSVRPYTGGIQYSSIRARYSRFHSGVLLEVKRGARSRRVRSTSTR